MRIFSGSEQKDSGVRGGMGGSPWSVEKKRGSGGGSPWERSGGPGAAAPGEKRGPGAAAPGKEAFPFGQQIHSSYISSGRPEA